MFITKIFTVFSKKPKIIAEAIWWNIRIKADEFVNFVRKNYKVINFDIYFKNGISEEEYKKVKRQIDDLISMDLRAIGLQWLFYCSFKLLEQYPLKEGKRFNKSVYRKLHKELKLHRELFSKNLKLPFITRKFWDMLHPDELFAEVSETFNSEEAKNLFYQEIVTVLSNKDRIPYDLFKQTSLKGRGIFAIDVLSRYMARFCEEKAVTQPLNVRYWADSQIKELKDDFFQTAKI